MAGWTTVREFRKLDTSTPVMMITADSGDFYAKPSLSNAFAQGKAPAELVNIAAAKMVETLNVTLMQHARVNAIDPVARTVSTRQGEFDYSQLVLATGAQPIRVPLQGNAASRVLSVNSLDDFAAFHGQLAPGSHVLIMGAGLIGCEFANDLAGAGYQVSVVDPSTRPMAALLPQAAGEELQQSLSGLNVGWYFGSTVKAVNQPTLGAGSLQVLLSDGRMLQADHVLSAIGLRADMALASAAGLACERGIVVDVALQTSSANIYALGDCAQYASAGARTLPYVMPIMNAAKALAATLAGRRTELAFPLMPVTIKTPALPVVVAAPTPGQSGQWQTSEPGVWLFADDEGRQRGFVLTGQLTRRRAEQCKLVSV